MYLFVEGSGLRSQAKVVKNTNNRMYCEVCIQTVGDFNKNKRKYNKSLMESGIQSISHRLMEGSLLGELDHPVDKNPIRQLTVLYKESSHKFREIGIDGNKVMSTIEILNVPNGNIMKGLIESKVPIGFSFRGASDGLENITENGRLVGYEVKPPLHVVTWDSVSDPSHTQARMIKVTEQVNRQLMESVNFSSYRELDNGLIETNTGLMYFPNDFDRVLQKRIELLKNKFSVGNSCLK